MICTIPIHEANDCHTPAGLPEGGQFCSKSAQLVQPGQSFDIVAAVFDKARSRRFLFNPTTREVALGSSESMSADTSHATAFADAVKGKGSSYDLALSQRYDKFPVHGWMQPQFNANGSAIPGTLDVIVSRTVLSRVEQIDAHFAFASLLVSMGAPPSTTWAIGFGPMTLKKAFPELFPTKRRRRTRAA